MYTLNTAILKQAIEDVLRFELGQSIEGVPEHAQEDAYAEALAYVSRYPSISQNLLTNKNKNAWLKEVLNASPR